ncbi:hypothetical protein AB2N08_18075 [Massilia aurea]|uniref:hypothetical protein n=1 Tax=Massilia aurea TaxID=373040 RepID=UPI003461863D
MPQDPDTTQHYERIGRFIYGFHRHTNPDALRALPPSHSLAARGAALAARFDRVVAAWRYDSENGLPDPVSEAEFSAILAEAQAFARDSGWQYGNPAP